MSTDYDFIPSITNKAIVLNFHMLIQSFLIVDLAGLFNLLRPNFIFLQADPHYFNYLQSAF